jgi:alanine racemase
MDQLCVEMPEPEQAAQGDVFTLIGKAGDNEIRAVDLAESIGATPHEITTCLSQRVPRVKIAF